MKPVTAVLWMLSGAAVGAAAWAYYSKWRKEDEWLNHRSDSLETAEDKALRSFSGRLSQIPRSGGLSFLAKDEPSPKKQPYGCDAFLKSCTEGDIGGCEYMRQSCATADNAVRMTMARPGECEQFRAQCIAGDYASCDQYNRGCLYESH